MVEARKKATDKRDLVGAVTSRGAIHQLQLVNVRICRPTSNQDFALRYVSSRWPAACHQAYVSIHISVRNEVYNIVTRYSIHNTCLSSAGYVQCHNDER